MNTGTLPRFVATLALLACAAGAVQAQSWEYRSYRRGKGGDVSAERFVDGTITLREQDGKAWLSYTGGPNDPCWRGEQPAAVTRSDATTTIEVTEVLAGCDAMRFVIRNDGSGGDREVRRDGRWARSPRDHRLVPRT